MQGSLLFRLHASGSTIAGSDGFALQGSLPSLDDLGSNDVPPAAAQMPQAAGPDSIGVPAAPSAATATASPASAQFGMITLGSSAVTTQSSTVPAYDHIVVVMEENHDYSQIIGSGSAPYINALAGSGLLLTNYSDSGSHPSEPNYFAIYAGSTFGVTDDNFHSEADPTLATVLQGAGRSFTGYVEGGSSDQNHNPWEYFPEGTTVEKSFASFPTSSNYASLPSVSFVIPNLDDMHNGTIAQGDTWLQTNIDAYAQWAKTHNSLLAVVWDEGASTDHVPAIFVGAGITPGSTSAVAYNHYNTLSTLLAAFGLTGPNNAAGAATIPLVVPCFAAGTRISVADGTRPVEELRAGDRVVSVFGGTVPVTWLGHRRVDCRRHPRPQDVWPVRVKAHAFAPDQPARDLLLSPDHALYSGTSLIPVRYLINGSSIAQEPCDSITYWHVELPMHDVILAEGLPAESYLDTGNRGSFANGGTVTAQHPDFAQRTWEAEACAPQITHGPILAALIKRLRARARGLLTKEGRDRLAS